VHVVTRAQSRAVAWIRNCEQSLDFAFLLLHVSTVLDGDSPIITIMA
jgi:hypothetical protein